MSNSILHLSETPIKFEPVTRSTPVFYDDTNQEVFAVAGDKVTVYNSRDKTQHQIRIEHAGNIISIKYSLDHKLLAVQKSNQSVDFLEMGTLKPKSHTEWGRKGSGHVIGFNWTCQNEIVIINHQGIEFYHITCTETKLTADFIKSYSVIVNWYVYSPQFCVLVVSSTLSGNLLHPFHFKVPEHGSSSVNKLPRFQVDLPQLLEREISIITLHGKLFLAVTKNPRQGQVCYKNAEICLYVLPNDKPAYRVATLMLGITGRFALNCIDNMIVVHHQNSKTSMLFDICWDPTTDCNSGNSVNLTTTKMPPLKIPNFSLKNDADERNYRPIIQPMSIAEFTYNGKSCELYSSNWVVFQPDIVIDAKLGLLWELRLSVFELSTQMVCSKPSLVKLLLHRRNYRSTILLTLRSIILSRSSDLNTIGIMFDIINSVIDNVIITQDELREEVFSHLLSKDDISVEYKISVILEYIRSLRLNKLRVNYFYNEIVVQLLTRSNNFYKLHQLVQFQVLGDSTPLAYLLLSLARTYEPAFLLGLDMLKRLDDDKGIQDALLARGDVTEAIKYAAANNKEDKLDASKFIRESLSSGDNSLFYATYRYFTHHKMTSGIDGETVALFQSLFNEV